MGTFIERVISALPSGIYLPKIHPIDIVEILILAFMLYVCMDWIQKSRAYTLLKGILIVAFFMVAAYVLGMSTLLWLAQRIASVAVLALVIIFQPELRKALESIGQKSFLSMIMPFDSSSDKDDLFSDKTVTELIRAVNEMSEVRTGALIVIEQQVHLDEYINTGITLDAEISSQLLVNIFEHNTPLHDGAVIIRGNRITSATCYLPLSDNPRISKRYGTRHRAGLGISEMSDAFTIIVSEETGRVSVTYMGELSPAVTASDLRERLHEIQKHTLNKEKSEVKFRIWKGKNRNEA